MDGETVAEGRTAQRRGTDWGGYGVLRKLLMASAKGRLDERGDICLHGHHMFSREMIEILFLGKEAD